MQHVVHHLVAAKNSNYIYLTHLSPTPRREPLAVPCFAFEGVTLIGSHAELPTSKQHVFSLWYLLLIRSLQLHSNPQNASKPSWHFLQVTFPSHHLPCDTATLHPQPRVATAALGSGGGLWGASLSGGPARPAAPPAFHGWPKGLRKSMPVPATWNMI